MAIYKKEEAWWPKLQKGNKLNFVKVDFQKWIDEDDEEEETQQPDPMGGLDFQSLMAQAGASGGLPNMDNLVSFYCCSLVTITTNTFIIISIAWRRRQWRRRRRGSKELKNPLFFQICRSK